MGGAASSQSGDEPYSITYLAYWLSKEVPETPYSYIDIHGSTIDRHNHPQDPHLLEYEEDMAYPIGAAIDAAARQLYKDDFPTEPNNMSSFLSNLIR